MELQLPEQQSAALAGLAARMGRKPEELIIEAVDRLLAEDAWFDEQVRLGMDQIVRCESLDEAEIGSRVARMLRH